MPVCTKGVVATRNKSVFFVSTLVERSLNKLIGSAFKVMQANRDRPKDKPHSSQVTVELQPDIGAVQFHFTHEGDSRMMWLFFECDCDNKAIAESSLSLSINDWGQSRLYVETVLQALRVLGPVHFQPNDASDAPISELDLPPMTYLDAVRRRLVMASPVSLKSWMSEAATGTLDERDVSSVLGFAEADAIELLKQPYEEVASRISAMASAVVMANAAEFAKAVEAAEA